MVVRRLFPTTARRRKRLLKVKQYFSTYPTTGNSSRKLSRVVIFCGAIIVGDHDGRACREHQWVAGGLEQRGRGGLKRSDICGLPRAPENRQAALGTPVSGSNARIRRLGQ